MKGLRAKAALTALTLTALLPGLSYALGFGDVHLHSALNAPLSADISIVASAEELQGLKASIASRETFARNGLDYPNFLASAKVSVTKAADGTDVLRVLTSDPVTEPFVTMLVEVNYARGRLLREYTVLLDPPVLGNQAVNGPISAPVSSPAANAPVVAQPPAPAMAPAAAPMPPASGANYRVQRGDTLSLIAGRQLPAVDRSKALLGLYRANPAAFDGNMNLLRAGAELRLPSEAELAALSPAEAGTEVARQYRAWHGDGRLRLVPPATGTAGSGEASAAGGGSGGSEAANNTALRHQVDDLQKQLAETKRLLDVRNEQLAQLQAQAAQSVKPATPAPAAPPAAVAPPVAAPAAPAAVPESRPAEPAPKPATTVSPKPAAASESAQPSLLARILDQWPLLLAALFIIALLAFVLMRRKQRADAEPRDFDRFGSTGAFSSTGAFEKSAAASQTLPARVLPTENSESILVSESGVRPGLAPRAAGSGDDDDDARGASDARATLASTGTQPLLVPVGGDDAEPEIHVGDSGTALERGDPLAEADFHMAYGLYDQAADLVKKAIAGDPARRELKLKLLEVYFVWGNKDQFLHLAHELNGSRESGETGEWEKIQIMGRQIAADDPMFAGTANLAGAAHGNMDLNLEGGQNRVDFNIMGEPTVTTAHADEIDLDFGNETDVLPDTAEARQLPDPSDGGVDFVLDDPERGAEAGETTASAALIGMPDATAETRQMLQATRVQPADISDIGDTRVDQHTAKMPSFNEAEMGTIRQKLGGQAALKGAPLTGGDQTAELAIDDLGLDLGTVEVPATTRQQPTIVEPGTVDLLLGSSTTHGGLDVGSTTQSGELSVTGEATALTEAFDAAATAARPALVLSGDTASEPLLDGTRLDADPPTMSEVGTKLDLARAYMDMGDPEGARSILDEVLKEGSASQKQEAQRLLESLPG